MASQAQFSHGVYTTQLWQFVVYSGNESMNQYGFRVITIFSDKSMFVVPKVCVCVYPLVNQHSNGKWPFIMDLPIKNGDFPLLC